MLLRKVRLFKTKPIKDLIHYNDGGVTFLVPYTMFQNSRRATQYALVLQNLDGESQCSILLTFLKIRPFRRNKIRKLETYNAQDSKH